MKTKTELEKLVVAIEKVLEKYMQDAWRNAAAYQMSYEEDDDCYSASRNRMEHVYYQLLVLKRFAEKYKEVSSKGGDFSLTDLFGVSSDEEV